MKLFWLILMRLCSAIKKHLSGYKSIGRNLPELLSVAGFNKNFIQGKKLIVKTMCYNSGANFDLEGLDM